MNNKVIKLTGKKIVIPFDNEDELALEEIHNTVGASSASDWAKNEIGSQTAEVISNAKDGKGKKCGDSFIEAGETCHVGESKVEEGEEPTKARRRHAVDELVRLHCPGKAARVVADVPRASWERFSNKELTQILRQKNNAIIESDVRHGRELLGMPEAKPHGDQEGEDTTGLVAHLATHHVPEGVAKRIGALPDEAWGLTDREIASQMPGNVFATDITYARAFLGKPKAFSDSLYSADENKRKTEKEVDQGVAKYLVGYVLHNFNGGDFSSDHGLSYARGEIRGAVDKDGWKSRVRLYEMPTALKQQILDIVKAEEWPKTGPIQKLVQGLINREVSWHDFGMVGKYGLDPYLAHLGATPEDITKFDTRMERIYRSVGVKAATAETDFNRATYEPSDFEKAKAASKLKPKASTESILGTTWTDKWKTEPSTGWYHKGEMESDESDDVGSWWKGTPPGPWKSAGAVVFNDKGEIAIRKVKGGFSGYDYSFGKGKVEDGETDEQAAHREVAEEQGHEGKIIDDLGVHPGQMSDTHFYLVKHEKDVPEKMDQETEAVHWMKPEEAAQKLDKPRDLRVLVNAIVAMHKHIDQKVSNAKTVDLVRDADGAITSLVVTN